MEQQEYEKVSATLADHEKKLDAIYRSVEKTRKYFLWTLVITIVTIVLPLVALAVLVPFYLQMLQLPAGL